MKTRAFKSGNSQAVRIPAELAYADANSELEITRVGDVITIVPSKSKSDFQTMIEELRRLPVPETVEYIERTEVPDRGID